MVELRKFHVGDKTDLAKLANNKKIFDHVRDLFPQPYSEKDAKEFIGLCLRENPPTTFAIEYRQKLAGVISLTVQNDVYRKSAELGYWIGELFWNKGIATNAVNQIVSYAFNDLGLIRVYAGVFEYNKASSKVLEKCGFEREGILKKAVVKNDKLYEEFRYSKINSSKLDVQV